MKIPGCDDELIVCHACNMVIGVDQSATIAALRGRITALEYAIEYALQEGNDPDRPPGVGHVFWLQKRLSELSGVARIDTALAKESRS